MKRSMSCFLFAALVAGIVAWVPYVHAFDYSFAVNCISCHNTPSQILEVCGMCHAHGVHSSALKNDINVSGTTDNTSYAPGETVRVTISGGYKPPTRARAVLYDQNGTQLAVSKGTLSVGPGPVNAPPWPVTLSSPAPTTPGTYTWQVAWYGHRTDAGSATFGAGWVADSGNADHGWEIVWTGSFTVIAPRIGVAPASKDYGAITAGSSSSQVFTLSNTGTASLAVSGMTLTDTTNFSLNTGGGSNPCGSAAPTIVPAGNCTVSVGFIPQSVSSFGATFSIASNDVANPTVNVSLTGNGVAGPVPNIGVSPASVDFGPVVVGNSSIQEVTLSNTGTANLNVSGIALSGSAAYSQNLSGGSNPCGSATPTIAPAGNCTIEVTFAPQADGGPFGATVTVSSNDPDTPNAAVSLTGTGSSDSDGDGVGDSVDDFPDDPSKATPPAATGTGKITVDAGSNPLSEVASLSDTEVNQTGRPPGYEFPHGLVTFRVAVTIGDNAVVILTFPSTIPEGAKYYQVSAGGFSEFPSAVIDGNTVTLVITDGGNGDNDGSANGTIEHIGGIATPIPPPSPGGGGGGGGGGGCSVYGVDAKGDTGAVLGSLALLAIFAALRRRKAKARR